MYTLRSLFSIAVKMYNTFDFSVKLHIPNSLSVYNFFAQSTTVFNQCSTVLLITANSQTKLLFLYFPFRFDHLFIYFVCNRYIHRAIFIFRASFSVVWWASSSNIDGLLRFRRFSVSFTRSYSQEQGRLACVSCRNICDRAGLYYVLYRKVIVK